MEMDSEGEIGGQMLIDACERNRLVIANTWCKKPNRRPGEHQEIEINIGWTITSIQEQHEGWANTAWSTHSDRNLLPAKIYTRLGGGGGG
jgi:hypothetical protein